jgi:hypothetical protein
MTDFEAATDPGQFLQDAIDHLIRTRGEKAVKSSRALQILANARHLVESACIADLLGEKARALGVRCPCAKCQAMAPTLQFPALSEKLKRAAPPPDLKMRAAADDSMNGK